MKKISKSSELLWLFGIIFVALGVSICSKADLGVSMIAAPPFVIHEALVTLFPNLTVGVVEYIIQGVLLIILVLIVRQFDFRYLLAFAVAVIYGYTLDLFMWLLSPIPVSGVLIRYVMLLIGDLVTAFGVACFFRTYMPLEVYELFVAVISDKFKIEIAKVKLAFDLSLLGISMLLAVTLFGDVTSFDFTTIVSSSFHSIGLGTIITTLINSPIIHLMGKLVDKVFDPTPRFTRLEKLLSTKS